MPCDELFSFVSRPPAPRAGRWRRRSRTRPTDQHTAMADHECSSRDAAFSSAINESLAWTSVLRPLKKKVAPAPPSEPSAATSANAVRHPHRQARSDDFHPDGTRFLKCRFFMMGTCAKGAKCHFMHWEPAAAPRKSHVHASSSSSSSALLAHQSSSSSVKTAVGPIAANPKSASASASASVLLSAASPIHSSVSMSSSIAPLDSKSCATMAAVESGHSDGDESDDEVQSAGRAPLPARAPQFDGDCETDSELYFYGAPGAQPVPVPVARVDTNNPTAAVSFAKMAARNIVHVPAMAFQLNAVVTSSTSIAAASTVGHGVSSTISLPSTLLSPSVAAPHRKPCVYFAQGSCRFGRVCICIVHCSVMHSFNEQVITRSLMRLLLSQVCRDLHSDRATCEHCHQSYPDDAGARDEVRNSGGIA